MGVRLEFLRVHAFQHCIHRASACFSDFARLAAKTWRGDRRPPVPATTTDRGIERQKRPAHPTISSNASYDALNEILHGGLEQGRWCVFLDGREQAKVYGKLDPEALGRLTALGVRERLTLNCRNTRPIAQQTALVSDSKWRVKARIDGRSVDFTPYRQRSGWLNELDRLVTTLRRDNIPPGRISILLLKNPRPDEEQHLTRLALRRLTEDDVPHLGTATLQSITWSTVSGFKGLENDVIIVAGLTDIESDWHRGVAYVGMSRARTRLHVVIREDCDGKRREREEEWRGRVDSDVEMLL